MNQTSISISAEKLRQMLDDGDPVTILDVRPTEERADWRIPESVHVDAYAALNSGNPDVLDRINLPKDQPIVTVCAAGRTSLLAALHLRERGYDVRSLEGGMEAWSASWNAAEVPLSDDDVTILQVRRVGKGCLTYIVGSGDEAAVIDAALDPEIYERLAAQHGWDIKTVLDTHIHADHLSRSRLLAEHTGATLYLPSQDRAEFPFEPVNDGDELTVGSVHLTALYTPGHTMESTSYLLEGHAVFTGDTLFTDGVGRPDLEASSEQARERAYLLFDSLNRLMALPGDTLVLPGHTGLQIPFDRESIDLPLDEVCKNLGFDQYTRDAFVDWIFQRIPSTPPNHNLIVELNEAGLLPGDANQLSLEAGANRCAVS